jgi:hypothetical protein
MKVEFSRQIFEKCSNIKFDKNTSNGSRIAPCARKDGYAGLTQPIVAFQKFAEAHKNYHKINNHKLRK